MINVMENLNGIIGVINTPFRKDYQIDYDSLRNYVRFSLKSGVAGFLTLGKAAEIDKLTLEEKDLIVKTVINEVKGRVPVICNISSDNQKDRLVLAKKFIDYGSDGIMINMHFEEANSYIRQITEIDRLKPGFIMIQDWDFKGYGIPVDIIKKLFEEIESFKCLKIEVVPAGVKYSAIRKVTENKLHLSGGWAASQMIEALDRGVNAFMPTVLYDIYGKIFNLHHAGKREEACKLFYELVPILAFSHQHLDISIHFNKRLVYKQGIFSTNKVRDPILPFDKYHERIAEELIIKAKNLIEREKANNNKHI